MEIITYIQEGALEHKDSLGNGSIIRPGDVQRMTAGSGITHSESNPSKTEPVHFLQIWILPDSKGLTPGYEQKTFSPREWRGAWRAVVTPDGRENTVKIHQNTYMYVTELRAGESATHHLHPTRKAYLHLARERAKVKGAIMSAGDGARVNEAPQIHMTPLDNSEALLFDLP